MEVEKLFKMLMSGIVSNSGLENWTALLMTTHESILTMQATYTTGQYFGTLAAQSSPCGHWSEGWCHQKRFLGVHVFRLYQIMLRLACLILRNQTMPKAFSWLLSQNEPRLHKSLSLYLALQRIVGFGACKTHLAVLNDTLRGTALEIRINMLPEFCWWQIYRITLWLYLCISWYFVLDRDVTCPLQLW